jgi:predicted tellurium resistance membrane protein TerC
VAELFTAENLIAFLTLTSLEIVLGIDNIIVIAIVTGRLPEAQRAKARFIGLALAMIMRILLLLTITWIMRLQTELFRLDIIGIDHGVSGKDIILILGGLFLVAKATKEIHAKVEGDGHEAHASRASSFGKAIVQILLLDAVFSIDSVITAVGMAQEIAVMIAAVVVAVIVMMIFAGRISRFVERHPTIKMLALAFLIMIGVLLIADGLGQHLQRGYIYFAMAFSLVIELLNMRARANADRRRAKARPAEIGD